MRNLSVSLIFLPYTTSHVLRFLLILQTIPTMLDYSENNIILLWKWVLVPLLKQVYEAAN